MQAPDPSPIPESDEHEHEAARRRAELEQLTVQAKRAAHEGRKAVAEHRAARERMAVTIAEARRRALLAGRPAGRGTAAGDDSAPG